MIVYRTHSTISDAFAEKISRKLSLIPRQPAPDKAAEEHALH